MSSNITATTIYLAEPGAAVDDVVAVADDDEPEVAGGVFVVAPLLDDPGDDVDPPEDGDVVDDAGGCVFPLTQARRTGLNASVASFEMQVSNGINLYPRVSK